MIAPRRMVLLWFSLAVLGACEGPARPRGPVAHAELGVFFGGQVQERREIPLHLDRSKQSQGFRLSFVRALARPLQVRWEIDRPLPRGRGRAVELGEAVARPGMEVFDQELVMRPGDPAGTWKFRVFVEGEVVIDRSVLVFDPAARKREPVLGKRAARP